MAELDRILRRSKTFTYTFTGLTADTVLTPDGLADKMQSIDDIDWAGAVLEVYTSVITATSHFIAKVVSTSLPNYTPPVSTAAATAGDNSATFATATIVAAGVTKKAIVKSASTGATSSDMGKYVGVVIDVTNLTSCSGKAVLYFKGKGS